MESPQNSNAASSSSASGLVMGCCVARNFHPRGWEPSTSTTTTEPPTTTTTTTSAPIYEHNFTSIGRAVRHLPCDDTVFDNPLYSHDNILSDNTILYTDVALTTPYNGGSLWYHYSYLNLSYRIGSDGYIIEWYDCNICRRPSGLQGSFLLNSFNTAGDSPCAGANFNILTAANLAEVCTMWTKFKQCYCPYFGSGVGFNPVEFASLTVGEKMYAGILSISCDVVSPGFYFFWDTTNFSADPKDYFCPLDTVTIVQLDANGIITLVDTCTIVFSFITPGSTLINRIYNSDNTTYAYGTFTGYTEANVDNSSSRIIKLNKDLTIDHSFAVTTGLNGTLFLDLKITKQPDGKIIVAGTSTNYNGTAIPRLVRINTDGSIDSVFNTNLGTGAAGGSDYTARAAVDSLNRIIVAGRFTTFNGVAKNRIVRLNSDGTIDPTFVVGTGFNNVALDVDVLADDSMIVVGYFTTYQGVAKQKIVKLTSTGSIDATFVVGIGFTPTGGTNYLSLARIPGETSFYVSGYIDTYKGITLHNITKLDSVGNIDPSFNPGTGFDARTTAVEVVWGNKLLITGSFLTYNGISANGTIVLNADGTILFTSPIFYSTPIVIGDTLYGRTTDIGLHAIFKYP